MTTPYNMLAITPFYKTDFMYKSRSRQNVIENSEQIDQILNSIGSETNVPLE